MMEEHLASHTRLTLLDFVHWRSKNMVWKGDRSQSACRASGLHELQGTGLELDEPKHHSAAIEVGPMHQRLVDHLGSKESGFLRATPEEAHCLTHRLISAARS